MMDHTVAADYDGFIELLVEATGNVGSDYTSLRVANAASNPMYQYRERVYCYELYHQLRCLIEAEGSKFSYTLSGEIDKQGHPLIKSRRMPDLLVHKTGSMDRNLVIIEVKSINASPAGVEKDLKSLTEFCERWQYHRAIFLVFGDDENKFDLIRSRSQSLNCGRCIKLENIDLYWHRGSSDKAKKQGW